MGKKFEWVRCVVIWFAAGQCLLGPASLAEGPRGGGPKGITYRNTAPGVAYVGLRACVACHPDVADKFARTDMGRSMSTPSLVPGSPELRGLPVRVFDAKSNCYFEVSRQGNDLYQSQYGLDASGNMPYSQTHKLVFAIGTGAAGITYAVQRDDILLQAPLSFYSSTGTWDLSPGYESQNLGFNRPVQSQCVACHTGKPMPMAEAFNVPSSGFRQLTIGCEDCHGPGELHVAERLKGATPKGDVDTSIVNPAKLPGWLADNICMNCHQKGDARVLKPGKSVVDFRPGTPLDDTLAIFQIPLNRHAPPQSLSLDHYYGMTLSKCYIASRKLSCWSCHDPHEQPAAAEKPDYFRKKCLQCHTDASCKLSLSARRIPKPPDDCASCHMPKRDLADISHTAHTDHRIRTTPGEPFLETSFQTTPQLPDLFHISAPPGGAPVPPVTLLEAYAQLASARPDVYAARYLTLLDQTALLESDNLFVLSALAQEALQRRPKADDQAIRYLSRAVELGSENPTVYSNLGQLLGRRGRLLESTEVLKRGLALAPYDAIFYSSLSINYITRGRYSEAAAIAMEGLSRFPEDPVLKKMLRTARSDPSVH